MFYRGYLRLKAIKEKMLVKFKEKNKLINQEIHVRDIFVYANSPNDSYGESKFTTFISNKYSHHSSLSRLVDHIESLANIANTYHQKYYCEKSSDGQYTIKKECFNKITRLSLNEFSLYGREPLKIDDFKLLFDAVNEIAKQQQENVHLLLSSIPVMNSDGKLLNVSLYVQCGSEPKIESFSKGTASDVDVEYNDKLSNFSQQNIGEKPSYVSGFIASQKNETISNQTIFPVRTKGGAEYTQAIDICFDHYVGHSKQLMKKAVDMDISSDTSLIPNQVDHMVTSNWIPIFNESSIATSVVQIDPVVTRQSVSPMNNDIVETSDLLHAKKNKYTDMTIHESKKGFIVKNPAFGSDFLVVPQEERKLGEFSNDLKTMVEERNKKVLAYTVDTKLTFSYPDFPKYENFITQSSGKFSRSDQLFDSLLKSCQFGFFEKFFKTESYVLKNNAKAMIKETQKVFSNLNKELDKILEESDVSTSELNDRSQTQEKKIPLSELQSNLIQRMNTLLSDLKFKLENIDGGVPHKFIDCLISKIDRSNTQENASDSVKSGMSRT